MALDKSYKPITVSTTGNKAQNVILWMDHRAEAEADFINATEYDLLKYVGGNVSLEMECPKLLWLKNHLYEECYKRAGAFFDLPDFLTFMATGSDVRSLCSTVCKWNYDAIDMQWSKDFFKQINLHELIEDNFKKIGSVLKYPGEPIGNGLSKEAAKKMGLLEKTPVSVSMIDAHAGALALLGCQNPELSEIECMTSKMAIICGTSSCHMSLTNDLVLTPGIWGPYKHAIIPNMYLNEAGQSATGILIDYIIKSHPSYNELVKKVSSHNTIYGHLNSVILNLSEKQKLSSFHKLTESVHVWPDFHGNRSPLADPNLKGMICGLTMVETVENLAIIYLAVIQSLAYGTKHILDALKEAGRSDFTSILLCGGLSKNSIFVQTHADICSIPVLLPNEPEAVLLGASILGACAAKVHPNLQMAASKMGGSASIVKPNLSSEIKSFHSKKYQVFKKMLNDQRSYEMIMNN